MAAVTNDEARRQAAAELETARQNAGDALAASQVAATALSAPVEHEPLTRAQEIALAVASRTS